MTTWLESSNTKQDGTPVTRRIKIPEMAEDIWFTENAYAEVSDDVADILANNIDSLSKVSEPDTPGSYYGDASNNTTIQINISDGVFDAVTAESVESDSVSTGRIGNDIVFALEQGLAADGTTDDAATLQSIIENNEGKNIVLEEGSGPINIDSNVAPTTTGERTVIVCVGSPTIDASTVSAGPLLNFANAPNVTIKGEVSVIGATGVGRLWSVRAGDGFRFDTLVCDTGQGGLDIAATDVRGGEVSASGHRDTDTGTAAAVHIKNATDVQIGYCEAADSDRGVEIEDGSEGIDIDYVRLENISNAGATTPETQKSLGVTAHTGTTTTDISIGDANIIDCDTGTVVNESGGTTTSVRIDRIREVDSAAIGGAEASFNGVNVSVGQYTIENPNTTRQNGILISGGDITFDTLTITDPPDFRHVRISGGDVVTINEAHVAAGSGVTGHGIDVDADSNVGHLVVRDWEHDGSYDGTSFRAGDNALAGSTRWAAECYDCEFTTGGAGSMLNISTTGNAPILVVGGEVGGGNNVMPTGSKCDGVASLTAGDVNQAVSVNDIGVNSGDPSAGSGQWAGNESVAYQLGATIEDTTNSNLYKAKSDGTWSQIGA